ncbi:hypothetical protein BDN70DRAFT_871573 [Pholiota conissans]|uniref:Uncharacterized protein n=1 Tax=Pholiota conissans TaxID=109636 RepID=A0A9P5ZD04_9AGAR|nr:hypothetical protein BDN70DRAFT_871573 [Pholiota conissans]
MTDDSDLMDKRRAGMKRFLDKLPVVPLYDGTPKAPRIYVFAFPFGIDERIRFADKYNLAPGCPKLHRARLAWVGVKENAPAVGPAIYHSVIMYQGGETLGITVATNRNAKELAMAQDIDHILKVQSWLVALHSPRWYHLIEI